MRVLVLGGTGAIGALLVEQLLAASHTTVIYVRAPQKLPEKFTSNANVTVHKGKLTNRVALDAALEDVDAVLSALGPKMLGHPADTPIANGYTLLISLMQQRGITRLLALGTPSIKDPLDKFSLLFTISIGCISPLNAYKDIIAVGEAIRDSSYAGLEWTLVRVPGLTNGKSKATHAGYIADGKTGMTLTRIAFGAFAVEELEKREWVRRAPVISSV